MDESGTASPGVAEVRAHFLKSCLENQAFLDSVWKLDDPATDFGVRKTWKTRLREVGEKIRKNCLAGAVELLLSIPSLAVLPLLLSIPYLPEQLAPSIILICPLLVVMTGLIMFGRIRTYLSEMRKFLSQPFGKTPAAAASSFSYNDRQQLLQQPQQPEPLSAVRSQCIFLPPVRRFIWREIAMSWFFAAFEVIGLLLVGAKMAEYVETLWMGYVVFFLVPILDIMRSSYDSRAVEKLPSLIAYDNLAFIPTRKPYTYDTATGQLEQCKTLMQLPFHRVSGLKLGLAKVTQNSDERGVAAALRYVCYVLLRPDLDDTIDHHEQPSQRALSALGGRIVALRIAGTSPDRERINHARAVVSIHDAIAFLQVLRDSRRSMAASADAIEAFLTAVLMLQQLSTIQHENDSFDALIDQIWERNAINHAPPV